MTRSPDPGWLRAAQTVYDACLWLYPKPLRDDHGDEMRQAFRDRCLEAVRGEQSVFRVLVLELLPDTLLSAGREQVSATFGDMRPRQLWAFGLLAVAALGLLMHDVYSGYVSDFAIKATRQWDRIHTIHEITHREKAVRRLAGTLLAGNNNDKALAAYLYSSMHVSEESRHAYWNWDGDETNQPARSFPRDGEQSTFAVTSVLDGAPDIYPLAVAARSCLAEAGCDQDAAIELFTRREPANAYAWSLAFIRASKREDAIAIEQAVTGMAQSSYYEDYQGAVTRDLLEAASKVAPGDMDFQAQVAMQSRRARFLDYVSYGQSIRLHCSLANRKSNGNYRWIEVHPEREPDCLRIAGILARSNDLKASSWGWKRIATSKLDPDTESRAYKNYRDNAWLWKNSSVGINRGTERRWTPWQPEQWQAWGETWRQGDGEIPSLKRWLVARGIPIEPPTDYKAPSIR